MKTLCVRSRSDDGDVCGIPDTSHLALDPAGAAVSALRISGSTSKFILFNNVQVVRVGSVAFLSKK